MIHISSPFGTESLQEQETNDGKSTKDEAVPSKEGTGAAWDLGWDWETSGISGVVGWWWDWATGTSRNVWLAGGGIARGGGDSDSASNGYQG